jgi:parvulin-like peptidyl-prolyl isomerase
VTRSTSLAAAVLALTGLLAACGDDAEAPPAAVVEGITISQQDLVDELEAIEANADYRDALSQSGSVLGERDGAFDTAFVASTLAVRVQYALVESEVAARSLDVDGACRDDATEQLAARLGGASPTGDGTALLDGFDDDYRTYLIDRETDFYALQADLSGIACGTEIEDADVEGYFEEHEAELAVETACASHILVETADEADEIAELLDGGADFGALASERSIDAGSGAQGGELGCGPAGRFVDAFDAAVFSQPVGEVGDPVQTEFGFHLILVTERSVATFDDVRDDVEATLVQERQQAAQQAFFDWFNEALASSEVEIDPRYGTWDASIGDIVGPTTEG